MARQKKTGRVRTGVRRSGSRTAGPTNLNAGSGMSGDERLLTMDRPPVLFWSDAFQAYRLEWHAPSVFGWERGRSIVFSLYGTERSEIEKWLEKHVDLGGDWTLERFESLQRQWDEYCDAVIEERRQKYQFPGGGTWGA